MQSNGFSFDLPYAMLLHSKIAFFVKTQKIMSVSDIAVEAVVFVDLVINIFREFVHSLVNSTWSLAFSI